MGDLDDDPLAATTRESNTSANVDSVHASSADVAEHQTRLSAFDNPLVWGSPDLADPMVRAQARR